jgi:AcrR family transcriptional regulator
MTETNPTNKIHTSTKSKIFRTAAQMFSEKGFNGVSVREISEASNVSKPMIYYYFGSKEKIYKSLVDVGTSHVFEALQNVSELQIPTKQKLIVMCQKFFQMSIKFPEFVKFYIGLADVSDQVPFMENMKREANNKATILVEMLQKAKDSGEFGPNLDPKIAAGIVSGTITHYVKNQYRSKKKILTDDLAENIIETLFLGFNE